jgi:hypothetical protein
MVRLRRWSIGSVIGTAVVVLCVTPSLAAPPNVEPDVQATLDATPTRTHEGPGIAVNPTNSSTVVLSEIDMQNRRCLTHISSDGGHTWADGASPQNSDYVNCGPQNGNFFNTGSNTALAYDATGNLYYAFSAATASDGDSRSILLGRSTNNGQSWTTTVVYQAPGSTDPDKADVNYQPSVTVDSGVKPARIYVGFTKTFSFDLNKLDASFVATSTDGGSTFGAPVSVSAAGYNLSMVVWKGNLYAFYRESTPFPPPAAPKLYMATSTDHGASFVATVIDPGAMRSSSPTAAVDPGNGTLIIAWYDNHLAASGAVEDDVFVKHSTDLGKNWTAAVPVSPTKPSGTQNVNQLYPVISAAPDGRVDVVWYDYRNDPFPIPDKASASYLGQIADVYSASSTDDGATFGAAVRLTDHPIDRRIGTWNGQYFYVMPPAVASSNAGVYAAWSDTRNGNPDTQAQDIFTTRVDIPAAATASASGSIDARYLLIGAETLLLGLGLGLLIAALGMRRRRGIGTRAHTDSLSR